jgi:phage-related minor tail protein
MALDLGELVGTLRMDVDPFTKALSQGDQALVAFAGTAKASASKAGDQAAAGFAGGLAGMDSEARAAGSSASAALGAGLDGAKAEAAAAGQEAGSSFSEEFKEGAKNAGAAAGAGAGVALGVGVMDNLNVEGGLNKLATQLNLSQADAKVAGELAGSIYANNFGEDLPQINDALRGVIQNMNVGLNDVDLQPVTEKVLTLTDAFDQDLGMTTAAVGQMIRTGMVKDAQEGLDVLTAGLQSPANKADDLAETMNEYGTQFRKLGLDGKDAMGLLSQGLQGGARDADIVADSMKEFSLKTQESTTMVTKLSGGETALNLTPLGEAFEAIGVQVLDANGNLSKAGEIFQKDLAGGGPKARKALDQVLDGIKNIEDPAQRTATMVSLFGTQAEDMGDALLNLDLDTTAAELGKVEGAADQAVETMGSGAQATIDTYKRKLIEMGRGAIEATGPTAAVAGAVAAFGPAVLQVLGPVATLIAARGMQAAAAGTAATAETVASGAVVRGWVMSAAASTAGAIKMAAAWLIALGPIALVIAGVALVVFMIVKYWDEIKEYTSKAWKWIVDIITSVPDKIGGVAGRLKQKGKDFLQGLKDGASEKWEDAKSWFSSIPEKTTNAVGGVVNTLKSKGKDLLQGVKDGATDKWEDARSWFSSIPEKATNAVGGVASTLKEKGRELIQGAKDGVEAKWEDLKAWFGGLGEKITNNVTGMGTLLKDAGIAIVQGLIDGIVEKFEALKDKVGQLTSWIKNNKGPKSVDLKLWRDPGNWIMQGLMDGLDDQMPALESKVHNVTDTIASTPMPTLYASAAPGTVPESAEVAAHAASRAGGGLTQNIYETTNAQATAAESARRLGLAGAGA